MANTIHPTHTNPAGGAHPASPAGFVVGQPTKRLAVSALASRFLTEPMLRGRLQDLNNRLIGEDKLQNPYFRRRGALVQMFPAHDMVLVGDLHGNVPRLDQILDNYGPKLISGEISLVFLGDILHHETGSKAAQMEMSFQMLNAVLELKTQFPEQVHFLAGNHDVVKRGDGMRVGKNGVHQALEFKGYLEDYFTKQGIPIGVVDAIEEEYQRFFENTPLVMVSVGSTKAVYAAHSPVVKGGATLRELSAARSDKSLEDQLLWNDFRDRRALLPPEQRAKIIVPGKIFTKGDVILMQEKLGVSANPSDTLLVGGHMRLDNFCTEVFPGFLVLHSNIDGSFGVIEIKNGMHSLVSLSPQNPSV